MKDDIDLRPQRLLVLAKVAAHRREHPRMVHPALLDLQGRMMPFSACPPLCHPRPATASTVQKNGLPLQSHVGASPLLRVLTTPPPADA